MPELPEVETIKNQLLDRIKGKKIKRVEIRLAKMIKDVSADFFKQKVEGEKIENIFRRAKLLIINLTSGYSLVIHLKISGQIFFIETLKPTDIKTFTHFIYYFSDGSCLLHNDLRQFGYIKLVKTEELKKIFIKEDYGPEPLSSDFTKKRFIDLLKTKPRKKIKPLLMDQSFIAGIGNIYAQEACWCAGVLPMKLVKDLSPEQMENLYRCLIKILKQAIKRKGTTAADDNYLDIQGKRGQYAAELKVYQREGQECFRCRTKIKKIILAGRGTNYCPGCQK